MSDDDGPPPVRSARVKPKKASLPEVTKRSKRKDPRFDPLHGSVVQSQFESNYKFLREMQEEEQERRKARIQQLRCIIRRIELEEALKKREITEEEFEEYDLSDLEEDVFEDHRDDLIALKRTPPAAIYEELATLQRESQLYTSRTKDKSILSRKETVKKNMLKKELQQVKEGTKQRPFFPKRSAVKRALIEDTYDRLDNVGGKYAVDRYLARKSKRQRL